MLYPCVGYPGLHVAFTGIRDLHPDSILTVRDAVIRWMVENEPATLSFGGALGSDTVGLLTAIHYPPAKPARVQVVVPGYIYQQPEEAYRAIRMAVSAGAEFCELCLDVSDPQSYWARNDVLVRPADVVVGFTDGRRKGGTFGTLEVARKAGKTVEEVLVRAT